MGVFSSLFPFLQNKNELAVVFDIGSYSVGGALFWMQESGVPKIVFSTRQTITTEDNEKIEIDRFLSFTIKTLNEVASRISTSGVGSPKKVFCVLASPWYVSQNRIIKLEKNIPFVFNEKLANELTKKEIKLFEEEHLKKYIKSGNKIRAIELKNLKTTLNGYEIKKSCNQKTKKLEMTLFISMSGEDVLSKIEETISKHFHTQDVKFSSFLMASFTMVRDMYPQQENFLLIDIGGEVTDISMVKKNVLRESISFPIGRNFMVRGVATALSCSLNEAKSLISLYKDDHAEEKVKQKIGQVIDKLKTDWLRQFQSSLANLSNDISIPATIFITIDQEFTNLFAGIIRTEQFNQYTLTESKFQIIFLDTGILHGVALFKEDNIRDSFLIIDTAFINRFLNKR